MQVFPMIEKDGMEILVGVNVKKYLTNQFVIKIIFGILAHVVANVIKHVT